MAKIRVITPNSLAARVQERMHNLRLSATPASKEAGLSSSAIRNILDGASVSPRGETLVALAGVLKTNIQWLVSGTGDKDATEQQSVELLPTQTALPAREKIRSDVPVRGIALVGSIGDFEFTGAEIDYVRRPDATRHSRNLYALQVVSDSMYPRFNVGDMLFVDPDRPPLAGDDVVLELHGHNTNPDVAFIKRLKRRNNGLITVEQFNPPQEADYEVSRIKSLHHILTTKELLGV